MAEHGVDQEPDDDLAVRVARLAQAAADARAAAALAERRGAAAETIAAASAVPPPEPVASPRRRWWEWRRRAGGSAAAPSPLASTSDRRPQMETSAIEAPVVPCLADGGRRVAMALLFGFTADEVAALVARIGEETASSGILPLFVTDLDDLSPFRPERILFERLPAHASVAELLERSDWEAYFERRLVLLVRKWRPLAVVPFGPASMAWLQVLRRSVHLDDAARKLLRVEPQA